MTTIVNTPPASNESGGNTMGMIIGLVFILVIGYALVVYALPALKNMQIGAPQINVPSDIDVNVKQTK